MDLATLLSKKTIEDFYTDLDFLQNHYDFINTFYENVDKTFKKLNIETRANFEMSKMSCGSDISFMAEIYQSIFSRYVNKFTGGFSTTLGALIEKIKIGFNNYNSKQGRVYQLHYHQFRPNISVNILNLWIYEKSKKQIIGYITIYIHDKDKDFDLINKQSNKEPGSELSKKIVNQAPDIYCDNAFLVKCIQSQIMEFLTPEIPVAYISTLNYSKAQDSIMVGHDYLYHNKIDFPNKNDYPSLNFDIDKFFYDFMKSKSNLLYVYGPPGTGKTTFTRNILKYAERVTISEPTILEHCNYTQIKTACGSSDCLIIEEADKYLGKREDGNSVIGSLLSGLDGFNPKAGIKLILCVNTVNLSKIDEALIRSGRCFAAIKIPLLTSQQALEIALNNNLQIQDYKVKSEWSLSDVYNPPLELEYVQNNNGVRIGFTK